MKKAILLTLAGLLVLGASSAWAQDGRFVIQPFAGYRTTGTFGVGADVAINYSGIRFTDGFAYGLSLGMRVSPYVTVEALWARSDPMMQAIGAYTAIPDVDLFKAAEDQFHANFIFYFGNNPMLQPFFVTGLGVTTVNPKYEGVRTETRFSWNLGLGFEKMVNEKVGLRVQAKWFTTYINDTAQWLIDWWGNVWLVPVSQYMGQWDLTGGLVFRF